MSDLAEEQSLGNFLTIQEKCDTMNSMNLSFRRIL